MLLLSSPSSPASQIPASSRTTSDSSASGEQQTIPRVTSLINRSPLSNDNLGRSLPIHLRIAHG